MSTFEKINLNLDALAVVNVKTDIKNNSGDGESGTSGGGSIDI